MRYRYGWQGHQLLHRRSQKVSLKQVNTWVQESMIHNPACTLSFGAKRRNLSALLKLQPVTNADAQQDWRKCLPFPAPLYQVPTYTNIAMFDIPGRYPGKS